MWFNLMCLISGDTLQQRKMYVSLCFMLMDIVCEFWIDCEEKKKMSVLLLPAQGGFVVIPMTAAAMLQNKLLNSF